MPSYHMGISVDGRMCAAVRHEVNAVRNTCLSMGPCHDCSFTTNGKKTRLCRCAASRLSTPLEDLNAHTARAIQAGHVHRCPVDNRYYSKTPVSANGRTYEAYDYYALPSRDYGLKAVNAPCGTFRNTVVRHAVLGPTMVVQSRPTVVYGTPRVVLSRPGGTAYALLL